MKQLKFLFPVLAASLLFASAADAQRWLRQSTASQEIPIGTLVDDTDGKTPETGLTIANTDIKLQKHGGTTQISKNSGGATHIATGDYYAVLDATDTDTLGNLHITVKASGALPWAADYEILPANVFDSLVLGTDLIDSSVVQWTGTNVASPATAGYPAVTIKDGTGTGEIDTNAGAVVSVTTTATATNLTNAPGAGDLTATMKTSVQTASAAAISGASLSTAANVSAVTAAILKALGQNTTIATRTDNDTFTLTAGSADDNAYNGWGLMLVDQSTAAQTMLGVVLDYTGSTKTVQLCADPGVFTSATGDFVYLLPAKLDCGEADATLAKLDDTLEDDSGTYRFTAHALEEGSVADWTENERTAMRAILGIPGSGTTPADPSTGILDTIRDSVSTRLQMHELLESAFLNCTVDTAFFAGSTNTLACIVTDKGGGAVTLASGDLTGLELRVLSGAQLYEGRFINSTTWDGTNNQLRLTLSRALPATLADAVTAIIR